MLWFVVVCGGLWRFAVCGGLWVFVVVCGGLWWFAVCSPPPSCGSPACLTISPALHIVSVGVVLVALNTVEVGLWTRREGAAPYGTLSQDQFNKSHAIKMQARDSGMLHFAVSNSATLMYTSKKVWRARVPMVIRPFLAQARDPGPCAQKELEHNRVC